MRRHRFTQEVPFEPPESVFAKLVEQGIDAAVVTPAQLRIRIEEQVEAGRREPLVLFPTPM